MGLFALPNGETVQDYLDAAKRNIELFEEHTSQGEDYLYLLDCFALNNLERAINKAKEKVDTN